MKTETAIDQRVSGVAWGQHRAGSSSRPKQTHCRSSREGTAYRFDWEKVRQAMRGRARELGSHRSMQTSAPDGRAGRAQGTPPPTW